MPLSSRLLVRSTAALLGAGFVVLLGIVMTTYRLGERAQAYFDEVIDARDARGAVVELRSAMQTAESSKRGFLYSGNEIYLAPYDTAKKLAGRKLAEVATRMGSFPGTQASLDRLTTVMGEKFADMDRTIALKRARRDDEALALFRTNRGKSLTDEANIFFTGLIRAADDRLTRSIAEQRSNAALLRWVTILGGMMIVAVIGGAAVAVFRYTKELAAARDEVRALNIGLEERVRERTADLKHANDEIQRFAYIVTHDLRAPLVNIMGFTRELEGSFKTLEPLIDRISAGQDQDPALREGQTAIREDIPEAIGFIRSSTHKMDGLINAILKLSRAGRRTLRPEALDLREVIETSVATIQHQLTAAGGAVEIAVPPQRILSDRLSLEQVFGNLFDNAVKYRSAERPLRVRITPAVGTQDRIGIDLADNGRGIAGQDLERIFEMFRRSGSQDQPGEGIGLSHVRALLRKLGGDISVTSVLNQGTTFRLEIPRKLEASSLSE